MTHVYFIRHAEPNYKNHDDQTRELTEKGMKDRVLVTDYLKDKMIDVVLSSPYKRAVDTVKDFADKYNLHIKSVHDFRERKIDSIWIEDFQTFSRRQWADFNYKYSDGEALNEVQKRNISALNAVLIEYQNKNIVVGSHGTALSTIINYYDSSFGYDDFERIKSLMPWVVKFTFKNTDCIGIDKINLFDDKS
ncbi:histidine phosphatase family protein [Anaerocolumna chitinilytica]|uniref:Phosphoglycerate mutase n=1 Tax=Anaerocolumna chitinilytica TaxID=1727145 RepID=A0A7I8DSJ9_9FIRM|nr:histidine phosphatase family protein [Anaerocolumna chitinilytica]BCK00698.1 phosphoglycerate mutase [Anaerocolumna chitinilytica]